MSEKKEKYNKMGSIATTEKRKLERFRRCQCVTRNTLIRLAIMHINIMR